MLRTTNTYASWACYFCRAERILGSHLLSQMSLFFHNTTLLRRGWESLLSLEILSPESRAQLALIVIGFGSLTIVICAVLSILWCFREFLFWLCGWKVLEHKKMEDRAGIEHNATRKAPEGVHEEGSAKPTMTARTMILSCVA